MNDLAFDAVSSSAEQTSLVARARPARKISPTSADIVASFNTWSFKREQPNTAHLEACIRRRMLDEGPVTFVLYWGKGPRDAIADPDRACLAFLGRMSDRVAALHRPGAEFRLIFTDTHAALNGHTARDFDHYFADIELEAKRRRFASSRLSDLVRQLESDPSPVTAIDPAWLERLTRSAERWFRGEGDAREGAERYYLANLRERRAVERAFPEAIFATFNGSDCDFLFPERMPKFYMYSLRKGFCIKPWFLDAKGRPVAEMPT